MHTQVNTSQLAAALGRYLGLGGFVIVLCSSARHGRTLHGALEEASWAMLLMGAAGLALGRLWSNWQPAENDGTEQAHA